MQLYCINTQTNVNAIVKTIYKKKKNKKKQKPNRIKVRKKKHFLTM